MLTGLDPDEDDEGGSEEDEDEDAEEAPGNVNVQASSPASNVQKAVQKTKGRIMRNIGNSLLQKSLFWHDYALPRFAILSRIGLPL